MNTLKLIAYPFGLAIAAIGVSMFVGIAAFGSEPIMWAEWQNQLISSIGTVLGFAGIAWVYGWPFEKNVEQCTEWNSRQ